MVVLTWGMVWMVMPVGVRQLPGDIVLDGELVVRENGRLAFERLQQRAHRTAASAARAAQQWPAHFVAFDLLHQGDDDLTSRPCRPAERRWNGSSRIRILAAVDAASVDDRPAAGRRLAPVAGGRYGGAGLQAAGPALRPERTGMAQVPDTAHRRGRRRCGVRYDGRARHRPARALRLRWLPPLRRPHHRAPRHRTARPRRRSPARGNRPPLGQADLQRVLGVARASDGAAGRTGRCRRGSRGHLPVPLRPMTPPGPAATSRYRHGTRDVPLFGQPQ
ncbi:hypothetical protein FPZ41_03890 [Streptomyces sp. K1PN6]|uniref:ATP-dependent DNA ligase family profile domain-containing protein n=1 Tax=Streptomyces acidicola TaxID=2596892 RepID=A0A5N8WKJ7_9ACTN|nr:hypothetical protein [Streptomyces acidicola]